MTSRPYLVTHRVSVVVTELVVATSAAEAIRLARDEHIGEAVGFEVDETREPTAWKATSE